MSGAPISAGSAATAAGSGSSSSTRTANFSSTPSSHPGGNASWYDDILTKLGKQPAWPEDKQQAIMEPYSYLDAHPGKEVRSQLIHAFNQWLLVPSDKLETVKKVVRMLHTSSLLMDDVEDNSDLRRGIPVAHRIYGVPQTINTANYVYFLVFEEIFQMSATSNGSSGSAQPAKGSVERLVVEEMINLHRGQGMDLFWRDSLICPTEEEYVEMVTNKTGGLFRIALKLMMAHSPLFATKESPTSGALDRPGAPDFLPLADLIGLLFQIRDDYMNLQSSEYADNKGFAEDLTEGKFSFPIIHAIRASSFSTGISLPKDHDSKQTEQRAERAASLETFQTPANRQILNVLKQRPIDLATKKYAVSYMRDTTRSFAYTREVLYKLDAKAREEVERIRTQLRGLPQDVSNAGPTAKDWPDAGATMLLRILDALRKGWYEQSD